MRKIFLTETADQDDGAKTSADILDTLVDPAVDAGVSERKLTVGPTTVEYEVNSDKSVYWILSVDTPAELRRKGHAKRALRELFKMAAGKTVYVGVQTAAGEGDGVYLSRLNAELAHEFKVRVPDLND